MDDKGAWAGRAAAQLMGPAAEWMEEPSSPVAGPSVLCFNLDALEVDDEADRWGPPDSETSCGTQSSEVEREERGRGIFVFSRSMLTGR